MQIHQICAAALPAVTAKLTEDLLPQVIRMVDWHRHPAGTRGRFEAWCAALSDGDTEAAEVEQLREALAIARRIVFAEFAITPVIDPTQPHAGPELEWSGGGSAAVATEMRKHLRILVAAVLGEEGMTLLAEDGRAEERLIIQVRGLVCHRLGVRP